MPKGAQCGRCCSWWKSWAIPPGETGKNVFSIFFFSFLVASSLQRCFRSLLHRDVAVKKKKKFPCKHSSVRADLFFSTPLLRFFFLLSTFFHGRGLEQSLFSVLFPTFEPPWKVRICPRGSSKRVRVVKRTECPAGAKIFVTLVDLGGKWLFEVKWTIFKAFKHYFEYFRTLNIIFH